MFSLSQEKALTINFKQINLFTNIGSRGLSFIMESAKQGIILHTFKQNLKNGNILMMKRYLNSIA
jgi:hypothetical protein